MTKNGAIDRVALSKYVVGNEAAMKKLEALVHPAVQQREKEFLSKAEEDGVPLVVLDNPLLFETATFAASSPRDVSRIKSLR